jgi:hypothetical protein
MKTSCVSKLGTRAIGLAAVAFVAMSPTLGFARSSHKEQTRHKVAQQTVAMQPDAPKKAITWWPVDQPPSFNEP